MFGVEAAGARKVFIQTSHTAADAAHPQVPPQALE
jgi:hypothetical protein